MRKWKSRLSVIWCVIKNITFLDAWILGYRTERDLAEAKTRIKQYQKIIEVGKQENTKLKVRTVILEGFLKSLIGTQARYTAWINNEDMRGIHNRFPRMEVSDRGNQTRIRLKENKQWRKPDVPESKGDGGETDGSRGEATDVVGDGVPRVH
jgi:hypothetical protein